MPAWLATTYGRRGWLLVAALYLHGAAPRGRRGETALCQMTTYDFSRFKQEQRDTYAIAVREIRNGSKVTHWMWYIFPQVAGLGLSDTSRDFAIAGLEEARAYLADRVLGPRLEECAEALLAIEGRAAKDIFGSGDAKKLRSCATLFAAVTPAGSVFDRVLTNYFHGGRDELTLGALSADIPET